MVILTLKALHLISMVGWFVGLFYLFRLLALYIENLESKDNQVLLKNMAYKLYFFVTTPFMLFTLIFGLLLLAQTSFYLQMGWFHGKLTLIFLLVIYHFFIGYTFNRMIKGHIFLTALQCRLLSHIPEVFLTLIIFLAVYKPGG